MIDGLLARYELLYKQLTEVVVESENRVVRDRGDPLFEGNVNFFVKSYLITVCTYLESYLQDVAFAYASLINDRLKVAKIPHNYIYWRNSTEAKDKALAFKSADYPCGKKEISDLLSANPYKTVKAFKLLGVDLASSQDFRSYKEVVEQIVKKRNNIIHHNDRAVDVSFSDVASYVSVFSSYMRSIDDEVRRSL